MSLAAAVISPEALYDILQIFDTQPWTKQLHEELAELWSLCRTREQQLLVRELMSKFCMFDAQREDIACKEFNLQIQNWKLEPNNTWIVATANSNEVDGSTAGLQKLKNKVIPYEEWHSRFIPNIPSAGQKILNGHNIVLFDDFIGSGKTMVRKIAWLTKILKEHGVEEFNLFCACFSGMKFGIQHIIEKTNLPVFSSISLSKGITESYPEAAAKVALNLMAEIEECLSPTYRGKKLKEYSMGYEQSEALYCAANDNCPNNVFPILWWALKRNDQPFKTLLRRAG